MGLWINLFYYWILTIVFQSVTNHLSLGGEVFWAGQHRKSGVGYAARYNTDKMVQWLKTCSYMHNQQLTCFPLPIYLISDILHLFSYLELIVVYSDVCKHIMPNTFTALPANFKFFVFPIFLGVKQRCASYILTTTRVWYAFTYPIVNHWFCYKGLPIALSRCGGTHNCCRTCMWPRIVGI